MNEDINPFNPKQICDSWQNMSDWSKNICNLLLFIDTNVHDIGSMILVYNIDRSKSSVLSRLHDSRHFIHHSRQNSFPVGEKSTKKICVPADINTWRVISDAYMTIIW